MRTNLINERKKNKLTQTEVSKIVSVTTRQYSRLEAGTSDGSIKVWQKLSNLFNQPIDYLLKQEDKPPYLTKRVPRTGGTVKQNHHPNG